MEVVQGLTDETIKKVQSFVLGRRSLSHLVTSTPKIPHTSIRRAIEVLLGRSEINRADLFYFIEAEHLGAFKPYANAEKFGSTSYEMMLKAILETANDDRSLPEPKIELSLRLTVPPSVDVRALINDENFQNLWIDLSKLCQDYVADIRECVLSCERYLSMSVFFALVGSYGRNWFVEIDSKSRQDWASRREQQRKSFRDDFWKSYGDVGDELRLYAYADLGDIRKLIFEKKWSIFTKHFPDFTRERSRFESDFERLRNLRNVMMHPTRMYSVLQDDYVFVIDFSKELDRKIGDKVIPRLFPVQLEE